MTAGIKLTQPQVEARFNASGYTLIGQYKNQATKVAAKCSIHDEVHHVFPSNIFRGQGLRCCGNKAISLARTGMKFTDSHKENLSKYRGSLHHGFGKKLSDEVKIKVSQGLKAAAKSIDYIINKAATGKTSGMPGYFYIAEAGNGFVKLGSIAKLTPKRRMSLLRDSTGASKLLLLAQVSDAGGYEAAMLNRFREYWDHGEWFKPSCIAAGVTPP